MKIHSWLRNTVLVILPITAVACTTVDPYTRAEKTSNSTWGALIGGASGAAIGALSGGNRGKRALIGAGVGVLAGSAVGHYMDRQEAELLRRLEGTGVSVTRSDDMIVLNMPGSITFATARAEVKADFYGVLDSVALVLEEYDKTLIEVAGHTDDTGASGYNQKLSEQRASSVGRYLESRGIADQRVYTYGEGEQFPVADNDSAVGRQRNRRVELVLVPLTA